MNLKPDTAYIRHNGDLEEEPAATFKHWMEVHQYDPEHGMNVPVNTQPSQAQPANGADAAK